MPVDTISTSSTSTAAGSLADLTRSLDLWYSDGSIVLIVENVAFRVHTSILASSCEIFRDMASIPQPKDKDDGTEKVDGCQVVRLQDSADDMKHFLKAIYKTSYFRPGVKTRFPVIAAVLRLSTKYQASQLRRRAIVALSTAYPSTLSAWDARAQHRLIPPFEGEVKAIIALAIESDVRVILPAVYYAASKRSLSEMIIELLSINVDLGIRDDMIAKWIVGCEKLRHAELYNVLEFLDISFPRPGCQNINNCNILLQRQAAYSIRNVAGSEPLPYQLHCYNNANTVGTSLNLCLPCRETVNKSIQDAREKIWKQLPSFFGFSDWETLIARDEIICDEDEEV
ncbi:hypothetical protein C8Q75DRAFT_805270 [Abortiporus biennis]|nr:hypothetical protein C8Q75DRAFT_805270 [Abortiporus biennis]